MLTRLFESASIGIAFFNRELRHVHVNAAYARMARLADEDLVGATAQVGLGDAGHALMQGLRATIETGTPVEVSLNFEDGTRRRHCVAVCSRLATDADGVVAGVMMRDITERTQADIDRRAALQSEQQLRRDAERQRDFIRLVLENAPMSIAVCEGPDYRLSLINDHALGIVGMSSESLIGRPIAETFPEAFPLVKTTYDRVYQRGESVVEPERLVPLPDGRRVWSTACYAPVRDAEGRVVGVMSLGLDVTPLKRAQLMVEAQKSILELIAQGASLPAVLDAAVQTVSEQYTGVLPAIMLAAPDGRRLRHASSRRLPPGFAAALDEMPIGTRGGSSGVAAAEVRRIIAADVSLDPAWQPYRDAALRYGIRSASATPIVGTAGKVLGTLVLYGTSADPVPQEDEHRVIDLMSRVLAIALERQSAEDERARLLEAERRTREAAEQANRMKDEFVATLSHELRTPLNAILGWARILRAGGLDATAAARALESIERNTLAQSSLVEDLLDMSRIITGKLRLDVRSVELSAVVDAAVDALRPAADAKNIRLQKVLDPRAAPISADPDRLQQVVWNLLSNAIKFTPKGGRVQIRLERINSHVEIIVSDTGPGIAPDLLSLVFDRFTQGHDGGTSAGGLGLGLSIARHLVELHGGTIHAASAGAGAGATFTVKLPLMVAHADRADADVHPAVSAGLHATVADLSNTRVAVVEDDADGRQIVQHILEHAGAEVRTAASAAEGYALVTDWKPQVLISDIEMPGEDGYALLQRLRANHSERALPAIALTAYARVEDRIRTLSSGFQMHVPKPVEPAELIAVVKAVIRQSETTAGGSALAGQRPVLNSVLAEHPPTSRGEGENERR